MNIVKLSKRREDIQKAAFQLVSNYGFKRTSMQDIADAVGISRPALYLEFKNKNEILRATASAMFAEKLQNAKEMMSADQALSEKLRLVLTDSFADFHRQIINTPHGEELMNIKEELAGDIYMTWLDDLTSTIAEGIATQMKNDKVSLCAAKLAPHDIATTIINSMNGIKSRPYDKAEMDRGIDNIIALVIAPK